MDNQPAFDRSLLFPISIGGFSVIGIIVVLLIGRALNSPADVPVTPSATRFQFLFLGTEPAITTPTLEESEAALTEELTQEEPGDVTPISTSDITPVSTAATGPGVSTPIILTAPNVSPTSTATLGTPIPNRIDDTDARLQYTGNWLPQTGVSGAYQGTLHRSDVTGNYVTFSFTGPEIRVFYQAGPSFGAITITIDGVGEPPLPQSESQAGSREWVMGELSPGTHIIVITHSSGGSVNIDSLAVPAPTATPTGTIFPTATPTSSPTPTFTSTLPNSPP
jgi:hypothetical protein